MTLDREEAPESAQAPTARHEEAAFDEQALVAAVRRKDRKATAEFVTRYADAVYSYIGRRLAPRRDLVEDLVQDVFLAGLQGLDRFAGDAPVKSWLLGIARHKIEDYYRSRLREVETPESVGDADAEAADLTLPDLDQDIDRRKAEEKTRRVIDRLPESYAVALVWRYWEHRSAREMAERTGRTEKSVERLLARARAEFKRLWEAD